MSPYIIIASVAGYFGILLLIAWYTSRNANNESYFIGNKVSPWYAVAFGMIGDSLSGVTFISVPGAVGASQFSYMQIVFGYLFGYLIIANILLPLYYKLNLISIYSYLRGRFGIASQRTGSFFFLLSRILGAAGRLYLAASVIQLFVFDALGIPFWISVSFIIILILIYTFRGGIKTLVWTDTFQSSLLLAGVILSIIAISTQLDYSFKDMVSSVYNSEYSKTFFWDWLPKNNFFKQFFGGMFIAVAMTGLDQNMMQKNLSCKSLPDAQKNMYWFSVIVVIVNIFFLALGVLLYQFAQTKGIAIPTQTDNIFPTLALQHLGIFAGLAFIVGLTAATFSSADSVLTTLTTSFYVDILGLDEGKKSEKDKTNLRYIIHIAFAVILLLVILLFRLLNDDAIIFTILKIAAYTYGPLLGLFAYGLFSKGFVIDKYVPIIAIASPIICYIIDINSVRWLGGYQFGNELLILNGLITFLGLWLIRKKM